MSPVSRKTHPFTMTLAILLFLVFVIMLIFINRVEEYRQYLTESRPALDFSFGHLSEDWTESHLRYFFDGEEILCQKDGSMGRAIDKSCFIEIASHNNAPAMFATFFFRGDRLYAAMVAVPWWSHYAMLDSIDGMYGSPDRSQDKPVNDVRLFGWALENGSGIFYNRDRSINPLFWSLLLWFNSEECERIGCFGSDKSPYSNEQIDIYQYLFK